MCNVRVALFAIYPLLAICLTLRGQRVENTSLRVPVDIDQIPALLSETGIFKNLITLEPEIGIIPYEPILSFWSDNAIKFRWVYIPYTKKIGYSLNGPWQFPSGSIWVKHFDIEMEPGVSESRKKIETRLLVKTDIGVYGVSYQWNEEGTDASLVGEDSVPLVYDISEGGVSREKQWEIPSRNECIECHTFAGGMALSFNTFQLNQEMNVEGRNINMLQYLSDSGILDTEIDSPDILPRYSRIDDASVSIDHRARSYIAVNCAYCHSPGGGPESDPFDGRFFRTLDSTRLVDGVPNLDYGDPLVRFVSRGDHERSAVWLNMSGTNGAGRMPPLATFERDFKGEDLIRRWIDETLPAYLSFDEWQEQHFDDTGSPEANRSFDADGDGDSNRLEFINRTNPNDANDHSEIEMVALSEGLRIEYNATDFGDYQLEASEDLYSWDAFDFGENAFKTLPEGEERIGVELSIDEKTQRIRFLRVVARER